ncbi:casein kinase 1 [Nematocida sp. LUAm3]|nr:casein kinase 1 [Nematocida sp. LUAm3]KAI5173977.1 casein kinase 1 [Nematocida sp. LUAm2]KAI5177278.1 casein kinase 1 [Nematocida sp. LUAm1]
MKKRVREIYEECTRGIIYENSGISIASKRSREEHRIPQPGSLLEEYLLNEKIGQGSFGIVYEGKHIRSMKKVAIKVETYADSKFSQLENEYHTYELLRGLPGFPRVYYFGSCQGYKFLVMEYLGMSLEDMLAIRNRRFCVKTIYMVGKRMIDLIKALHSTGKVHRDLKPDNFLIGRNPKKIYLIDMGMAKSYMEEGQHVSLSSGKRLTGTPRYASVYAHKGYDLGRRDDLESIGYIMFYLTKGSLPWQGLKESKREKCRIIGDMKKNMNPYELSKDIPGGEKLAEYFVYVRKLDFDSAPDYAYLKKLLDEALYSIGLLDDGIFEWEYMIKSQKEEASNDSLDGATVKRKGILRAIKNLFRNCLWCYTK